LSRKPLFVLGNIDETQKTGDDVKKMEDFCREKKIGFLEFSAKLESEIVDIDESERDAFLKELGIDEIARGKVIKSAYEALGYITFFTVKGSETKAWPVRNGATAIEAAGKIHSDIQKGFIKAEVINYRDLAACGSMQEAKKKALLKLEGKEYVVSDGDIIDFKFNV
jgi:ribosome-binding ATPase YchF (GTP1/OBG family)